MNTQATAGLREMLVISIPVIKETPKPLRKAALEGLRIIAGGIADIIRAQRSREDLDEMGKRHFIKFMMAQTSFERIVHREVIETLRGFVK